MLRAALKSWYGLSGESRHRNRDDRDARSHSGRGFRAEGLHARGALRRGPASPPHGRVRATPAEWRRGTRDTALRPRPRDAPRALAERADVSDPGHGLRPRRRTDTIRRDWPGWLVFDSEPHRSSRPA